MNAEKLERYRRMLLDLRERVTTEVNYVVASIQEEVSASQDVSSAPVHLADVAGEAVDADVQILHNERSMREQINAALDRIAEGTFGRCRKCRGAIAEERLKAIPYSSECASCARATEHEAAAP
jgi:RNA polymerase-binding transcription factor DksA